MHFLLFIFLQKIVLLHIGRWENQTWIEAVIKIEVFEQSIKEI